MNTEKLKTTKTDITKCVYAGHKMYFVPYCGAA